MSSQPQKPHPPQAPPNSPETWITAAETAAAHHLSLWPFRVWSPHGCGEKERK